MATNPSPCTRAAAGVLAGPFGLRHRSFVWRSPYLGVSRRTSSAMWEPLSSGWAGSSPIGAWIQDERRISTTSRGVVGALCAKLLAVAALVVASVNVWAIATHLSNDKPPPPPSRSRFRHGRRPGCSILDLRARLTRCEPPPRSHPWRPAYANPSVVPRDADRRIGEPEADRTRRTNEWWPQTSCCTDWRP